MCFQSFSFRRKHFFKGFEIQNFFCCSVLGDISLEALLFILENRTDFSQNHLEFHFPKMVATLYAWSHSLCKGWTSFCTGLISRKLCRFLLMFLSGFTSLSALLLFPQLITVLVFMHRF